MKTTYDRRYFTIRRNAEEFQKRMEFEKDLNLAPIGECGSMRDGMCGVCEVCMNGRNFWTEEEIEAEMGYVFKGDYTDDPPEDRRIIYNINVHKDIKVDDYVTNNWGDYLILKIVSTKPMGSDGTRVIAMAEDLEIK